MNAAAQAMKQKMLALLATQTTAQLLRMMQQLSKRTDEGAELVYDLAFLVLSERIGFEKAEEYSDDIMGWGR